MHCDPQTVRGVMQERGLVACQPRRRARTTVPANDVDTRPDWRTPAEVFEEQLNSLQQPSVASTD